ncbi:GNAT family N-acetyltransferase [Phycicoccus sp. MAQZ13P-2]|uniref:GNAT family N-acetyltransferase n=1 Tax=Phycicoccus mangrovi TaxID=2840470 RepID=UPI001C0029ED|nr:GNAT family N-acetyltransferase [Phycicoccus mangrovi]MBT9257983.1 GNAT family N-acetyltransferase [Phycicoccus mangrovi]MBT9276247.1 GNAT family N-acetyltransferase [Phycicoccus mangrovi]
MPTPLPTPTLETARLRLRPVRPEDADALFALMSDPVVLRYWDAPPWRDRDRAPAFVRSCERIAESGSGARLVVERRADGAFLGWCALAQYDAGYRSAVVTYVLRQEAWGRGYATEAGTALLDWAFATLDLNRVQGEADTRNPASRRVMEKLGFVHEGTLREDCVVEGEVSDTWVLGLLRRDREGAAHRPRG